MKIKSLHAQFPSPEVCAVSQKLCKPGWVSTLPPRPPTWYMSQRSPSFTKYVQQPALPPPNVSPRGVCVCVCVYTCFVLFKTCITVVYWQNILEYTISYGSISLLHLL